MAQSCEDAVMRENMDDCSVSPESRVQASLLKTAFHRVLLLTAAIIAGLFVCAAAVEWIRSAYLNFSGFADYTWFPKLKTFLYLMTMFNVMIVRYAVMRIYIAPGPDDFGTIVGRLAKADVVSMIICGLPCLYGLILFLLSGDLVDFYLLFGLSIIYYMIYFPRYKKWVSIIEDNEN
ncbi:MAG: hypothetical protein VST72_08765 [Nitrospirota bacterium]|nr:hypothetical protein [Nitrospirota bacterium]